MKKTKKVILSLYVVFGLLLIGISYAFFSYLYQGETNKLITGKIYMNYVDDNGITIEGEWPQTKEDALAGPPALSE